jgi:hypothetical protein
MFVTHAPVHLPSFQQLAHRMMSRLIPSHTEPEIKPLPAEAQEVGGIALEHWDLLFSAVTERLRLSMEALEAAMADVPGAGPATAATRVGVLECVEALNQLRTSMCKAINNTLLP